MEELLSETACQSTGCFLDSYSPARRRCRVLMLCFYIYVAGFDSISDLVAWGAFLKNGFGHPLLPIPPLWSIMWGTFAITGLLLALASSSHEVMKIFHLKGNFCLSHAELMPLVGLLLEDIPMLVLTFLYGLSQYTCSTRSITESNDALVPILISSIATALATFWRLILTLLKLRERDREGVSPHHHTKDSLNIQSTPRRHSCCLKHFLLCCYKTSLLLFGAAVFLLSLIVVGVVTYLMVQRNPYLIHRPHDPLMILSSYPSQSALTNVSTVVENGRMEVLYGNHCHILFQYMSSKHKIVYNFADIGSGNGSHCNTGKKATACLDKCTNLFYGSYKTSDGEHVEKFHEMCLASYVILPHISTRPEWKRDMEISCVT